MSESKAPIVLHLESSLIGVNALGRAFASAARHSLRSLFGALTGFWSSRVDALSEVIDRAGPEFSVDVFGSEFVSYLQQQKAAGRRIIIIGGRSESALRSLLGGANLLDTTVHVVREDEFAGRDIATVLHDLGEAEFVLVGSGATDRASWSGAKGAIVLGGDAGLLKTIGSLAPIEAAFYSRDRSFPVWVHAMRPHQWLKNLLLLVPALTAFSFGDPRVLTALLLAFFAFSFTASATYLLNDIWDIESDRAHPRKKHRPFASGKLTVSDGLLVSVALLVIGVALASVVSLNFMIMLLLYVAMTTAYSWYLKTHVLMDVVMLASLHAHRILAGAVAISVEVSTWLVAFSIFVFLSLALVKRCAELLVVQARGGLSPGGRDYRVTDLVVLWPLGVSSAIASVVVFGLFSSASDTQARYGTPELLWLVALVLTYWFGRLWIKTARGEMHDDPIIYAIKDRGSRIIVAFMILLTMLARFLESA